MTAGTECWVCAEEGRACYHHLQADLERTKRNHLRRMEEASRRAQEKANKRLNERLTALGIPLYSATADKQRERLDKYWRLRQRIRAALERKADA